MKDPLGVSPSKGNQGTTRGKEKIILTSVGIEPTTSGLGIQKTFIVSSKQWSMRESYTSEMSETITDWTDTRNVKRAILGETS